MENKNSEIEEQVQPEQEEITQPEHEEDAGEDFPESIAKKVNHVRFKGDKNISIEELPGMPEKIRVFCKSKKIPKNKDFHCKVFRLEKSPQSRKADRVYCGIHHNEIIEEPEIKEHYGGGDYVCYYGWSIDVNETYGFYTETYTIDGPPKKTGEEVPPVSPELRPAGPALTSPPPGGESELDKLKKMAEIFQLIKGKDDPVQLIDRIAEKQINSLDKFTNKLRDMALENSERILRMTNKAAGIQEEEEEEEEEQEPETSGSSWPPWLEAFGPLIQKYAAKLLGDSPEAVGLRTLVQGSDVFKKRWADTKKRGEAIDALKKNLGKDLAEGLIKLFNEEIG